MIMVVMYWMLLVCGITTFISVSSLTKPIREWFTKKFPFIGKLLNCTMCTGFWVGLAVSYFWLPLCYPLLDAFVSLAVNWLFYSLTFYFNIRFQR